VDVLSPANKKMPQQLDALIVISGSIDWDSAGRLSLLCRAAREGILAHLAKKYCETLGWEAFYAHPALRLTSAGVASVFNNCQSASLSKSELSDLLKTWVTLQHTSRYPTIAAQLHRLSHHLGMSSRPMTYVYPLFMLFGSVGPQHHRKAL